MIRLSMLLLIALHCAGALAQTYPNKPIRVINPTSPGYGCDALARLGGRKVGEPLRQQRVHAGPPELFTATMRKDFERWGTLARDITFQPR